MHYVMLVLKFEIPFLAALMDPEAVQEAVQKSREKGYLDGAMLAEVFAWLRPNDLVWNYWVNNYLQGKPPPAFDILYWNADTTRMTAGLHRDFIEIAVHNSLTRSGAATMLGSPVDLSAEDVDTYVTAGIADHLCPWQACYRTTQLLGGRSRFVLSTNGHIASLVNPPTNPKSTFQVALRWIIQQDCAMAISSTKLSHDLSDLDLFDFELSAAEMATLSSM